MMLDLVVACFLIYLIQTTTSDCPFPKKEQIPNGRYFYRSPEHANWKMAPENYPLHFRCSWGYIKRGAVRSVCRNGRWSRSVPKCLALKCTDPPEILNGNYTLDSGSKDFLTVGTKAIYNCNPDQELDNSTNSILTCTLNWGYNEVFWNGTKPECVSKKNKHEAAVKALKCTDPPEILNGEYKLSSGSNNITIGTQATYTCDPEFELDKSTDSVLTCMFRSSSNEAFWKGTEPACICKTG